jgi:hypothetical protein
MICLLIVKSDGYLFARTDVLIERIIRESRLFAYRTRDSRQDPRRDDRKIGKPLLACLSKRYSSNPFVSLKIVGDKMYVSVCELRPNES